MKKIFMVTALIFITILMYLSVKILGYTNEASEYTNLNTLGNEVISNTSNNETVVNEASKAEKSIKKAAANGEDATLEKHIVDAKILDTKGNEVTEIKPNETYKILLSFAETPENQFIIDSNGKMTYELSESIKIIQNIEGEIYNENNAEIGKYLVSTDGKVTIYWNKVDKDGNPSEDYYVNNYTDVTLDLSFDVNIKLDYSSDGAEIDFGNGVKISVSFSNDYAIDIEKKALQRYDSITNTTIIYDSKDHTIEYTATVTTKDTMSDVTFVDTLDPKFDLYRNEKLPLETLYEYEDGTKRTVYIDCSDYPISIKIMDTTDGIIHTIQGDEIKKYIEINDSSFTLKYFDQGKNTVAQGTKITVKYATVLKDEVITGTEAPKIEDTSVNTATVNAKNPKGEEVNSKDTVEVPIEDVVLNKYGYRIDKNEEEYQGIGLEQDAILWSIEVGDGSTVIDGTKVTDKLGEGLSFVTNSLVRFSWYDVDKKEFYTKTVDFKDSGIKVDGNSFTYTIPDGNPKSYIFYKIEFLTYYDANIEELIGKKVYSNTAISDGPMGTHIVSNDTVISGIVPTITKTGEVVEDGTKYEVTVTIPKEYSGKRLFLYDVMGTYINVWDKTDYVSKTYLVDFLSVKDQIEKSFSISVKDTSGSNIPFYNLEEHPEYLGTDKNTYSIIYAQSNEMYVGFNGNDYSNVIWNIDKDSTITINYTIPFDAEMRERESGEYVGKLEEYTGDEIINELSLNEVNSENQIKNLITKSASVILPEIVNKQYEVNKNSNISEFSILINKDKKNLSSNSETLLLQDVMSPNLELNESTIKLYEFNESTDEYDIPAQFTYKVSKNSQSETVLELEIPDSKNLLLTYNARMKSEGVTNIYNSVSINGVKGSSSRTDYVFEVHSSSAISGGTTTGGFTFYILKYGKENLQSSESIPLEDIEFDIYKIENDAENKLGTVYTNSDGYIELTDMGSGTYCIKETSTQKGYSLLRKPIFVSVDNSGSITASCEQEGYVRNGIIDNKKVIEILNTKRKILPSTGGHGIYFIITIGFLLVLYGIRSSQKKVRTRKYPRIMKSINKNKA